MVRERATASHAGDASAICSGRSRMRRHDESGVEPASMISGLSILRFLHPFFDLARFRSVPACGGRFPPPEDNPVIHARAADLAPRGGARFELADPPGPAG